MRVCNNRCKYSPKKTKRKLWGNPAWWLLVKERTLSVSSCPGAENCGEASGARIWERIEQRWPQHATKSSNPLRGILPGGLGEELA
eukprot:793639-Pyramimonas_sp.AAC.1